MIRVIIWAAFTILVGLLFWSPYLLNRQDSRTDLPPGVRAQLECWVRFNRLNEGEASRQCIINRENELQSEHAGSSQP
jgi:hypothetical protein